LLHFKISYYRNGTEKNKRMQMYTWHSMCMSSDIQNCDCTTDVISATHRCCMWAASALKSWLTEYTEESINPVHISSVQDASYCRYSFICIGIGSLLICVFDTCCKMQSRQAFCNVATANRHCQVISINWPTINVVLTFFAIF